MPVQTFDQPPNVKLSRNAVKIHCLKLLDAEKRNLKNRIVLTYTQKKTATNADDTRTSNLYKILSRLSYRLAQTCSEIFLVQMPVAHAQKLVSSLLYKFLVRVSPA